MSEKKWHRDDLEKYTAKTKIIGFRCDATYSGTGTEARELLKSVFKLLISLIPNVNEKLSDYLNEIEDVNKIIAIDIMKEG